MINAKENQLKKCITLTQDEFNDIISQLFEEPVHVKFYADGISVFNMDTEKYFLEIEEKLSFYFNVKVLSTHMDDCMYPCIWIVYE